MAPKDLPIPVEADAALRTSDSITFSFPAISQALTKLVIQGMQVVVGKAAYADGFSAANGGIEVCVGLCSFSIPFFSSCMSCLNTFRSLQASVEAEHQFPQTPVHVALQMLI